MNLSFIGDLSLSPTNGPGSILLFIPEFKQIAPKGVHRDYSNCYLHHKRLSKMLSCGHRCFRRI